MLKNRTNAGEVNNSSLPAPEQSVCSNDRATACDPSNTRFPDGTPTMRGYTRLNRIEVTIPLWNAIGKVLASLLVAIGLTSLYFANKAVKQSKAYEMSMKLFNGQLEAFNSRLENLTRKDND